MTTPSAKPVPLLNIPNLLSAFRLVGSVVLVGLALADARTPFTWLLGALLISDWVDGKLAIAWKQQTTFGARLDSVADASMYAAMCFGLFWLLWDLLQPEWPWLAAVIVSYVLTTGAGLLKYGRVPSYHTRMAKTSWLFVSLAALALFASGRVWPLRLAATLVVLTNGEAIAMTALLRHWHADVPSIFHALQLRRKETP